MSRTSRERYTALRQSAWRHPKVRRCSKGARSLWFMSLSYVPDFKTDGLVPAVAVPMLDGTKAEVAELLAIGLWESSGDDFVVHAYLEHNPSDEEMEAVRDARRLAGSKGGRRKAERVASATANGVASASQVVQQAPTKNVPDRESESESDRESDLSPGGESSATPPPVAPRRRDVHDYHGAQATAAQVALGAALVAAGGTPKPRGGFPQQQAWAQVACDAHELAESLGRPVAEVLALSATGFVATRGIQAQATWWAEDFGRYYEAGRKGAPRKAGSMTPLPKLEDYKPTTDEELDAMFGPEVSA